MQNKFKTINGFTKESMIAVLKKQFKGQALEGDGNCRFLTSEGKKCAVGCFIPDDKYNDCIEGLGVDASTIVDKNTPTGVKARFFRENYTKFMPLNYSGMGAFQAYHDCKLTYVEHVEAQLNMLINWVNENVVDA